MFIDILKAKIAHPAEVFGTNIFPAVFEPEKSRTITAEINFFTSPAGKVSSCLPVLYPIDNILPAGHKWGLGDVASDIHSHHTGHKAAERVQMEGGKAGIASIEVIAEGAVLKFFKKISKGLNRK